MGGTAGLLTRTAAYSVSSMSWTDAGHRGCQLLKASCVLHGAATDTQAIVSQIDGQTDRQHTSEFTHWQGCGEKGTLLYCWRDCKLGHPVWKSIWRTLRKSEIDLPKYQQHYFWEYAQKMHHHAPGAHISLRSLWPFL